MRPNRELLSRAGTALLRRAAHRAGYDLVPAGCYSPIVDTSTLPREIWNRPAAMPGVELDLDAQLGHIERRLLPHLENFNRDDLENPMYGPMDAPSFTQPCVTHVRVPRSSSARGTRR